MMEVLGYRVKTHERNGKKYYSYYDLIGACHLSKVGLLKHIPTPLIDARAPTGQMSRFVDIEGARILAKRSKTAEGKEFAKAFLERVGVG